MVTFPFHCLILTVVFSKVWRENTLPNVAYSDLSGLLTSGNSIWKTFSSHLFGSQHRLEGA